MHDLRRMHADDVEVVAMLADTAFAELETRQGRPTTRVAGAPPVHRQLVRREDLAALLDGGAELLVADDGYAVANEGVVVLVAATREAVAADLLRAAVATAPAGAPATVRWLTGSQQWAVRVCLDLGLVLRADGGAVCTRGDIGPFHPYLPSGTYP